MSVHEGDRMDNRFTLPVKAEELARHTLIVTKNEKLFLPEYNEWITNKIRNYAIEAYLLIREANDLKVKVDNVVDPDVLKDRHDMQKLAPSILETVASDDRFGKARIPSEHKKSEILE